MKEWADLLRRDDVYLPEEFREGEAWFENVSATDSPGVRVAFLCAGRAFHPGYVALFDAEGRPLCYVPCNPEVF